jgi:hypothetical protein
MTLQHALYSREILEGVYILGVVLRIALDADPNLVLGSPYAEKLESMKIQLPSNWESLLTTFLFISMHLMKRWHGEGVKLEGYIWLLGEVSILWEDESEKISARLAKELSTNMVRLVCPVVEIRLTKTLYEP